LSQSDPQSPPVLMVSGDALSRYGFGEGHPFGLDRHEAFLREMRRSRAYGSLRLLDPVSPSVTSWKASTIPTMSIS
jgi:hypothetical protein